MKDAVIHIPFEQHKILLAYKKGEGINITKQIEFLIKESPRYKDYVKESK